MIEAYWEKGCWATPMKETLMLGSTSYLVGDAALDPSL